MPESKLPITWLLSMRTRRAEPPLKSTPSIALAKKLHPTPAVGGLPQQKAINFIRERENFDRQFYAGFFGIETDNSARFYVNLRSMQLFKNGLVLYAGGGITAQSNPEAEWEETERKLQTLLDVGLSYIRLGQAATTLSGGEAQRVKLALELSKRDTGRTLYILDEPTTGLHFADIALLLKVLHQLRDAGNTIVVIEHNLDVIKTADWLIDMGPEGGSGGGTVVGVGTPETLAENPNSFTGRYLKRLLEK